MRDREGKAVKGFVARIPWVGGVFEPESTPTALHPKTQRRERSERTLGNASHFNRP